jgi:hypothetical protein
MDQLLLKELQIIQQQQQQRQQQLNLLDQLKRLQYLLPTTIAPAQVPDQSTNVLDALLIRHLIESELQGSVANLIGNSTPAGPRSLSVEEFLRLAASQRLLANQPTNNPVATAVIPVVPSPNPASLSAPPTQANRDETPTRKRPVEVQEKQVATLTEERKPKKKRKVQDQSSTSVSPVRPVPAVASIAGNQKLSDTKAAAKVSTSSFPLPSLGWHVRSARKPKLSVCNTVWNGIKTKEMRKEVFLRKLHAGKLPVSTKFSPVAINKGAKKEKRPSC